jgi:hypothetical protein
MDLGRPLRKERRQPQLSTTLSGLGALSILMLGFLTSQTEMAVFMFTEGLFEPKTLRNSLWVFSPELFPLGPQV